MDRINQINKIRKWSQIDTTRARENDFFMACFKCGTERAAIHLSQVIDGKSETRDYCEACLEADLGRDAMLEMKQRSREEFRRRFATDPEFKAKVEADRERRKQAFAAKLDELCVREPRFRRETFEFIFAAIKLAVAKSAPVPRVGPHHVTAAELVRAGEEHARETWGGNARAHLGSLGLVASRNFGDAVFLLVNHGLLGKLLEDNSSDFDGVPFFDGKTSI